MLIVNLTIMATQQLRLPSDVWADYQRNPSDFRTIWAYWRWVQSKQPAAPAPAKGKRTQRVTR